MERDNKPSQTNVGKFVFSKKVADLDLFKYDSVEELLSYIASKDIELNMVKLFIKKANREMRVGNNNKRLFIRKTYNLDKEIETRICVTTK